MELVSIGLLSKAITVLGLCLDIFGASFLAYDIFYNPGKIWWINTYKDQLSSAKWLRDSTIEEYKRLPQPPYTPERIQKFIDEETAAYERTKSELETNIKNHDEEHPKKAFKWGWRGLKLLIIGFFLQAVGTIIG